MHLVENWQRPASDDINPDALEYLFSRKKHNRTTPWVEMASEPEPVVRITPEYIRLQTRVEILKATIELTSTQLQEAHHKIGMLAAELARGEAQIKELTDFRAKAAMAIAHARQNELLQLQVVSLRDALALAEAKPRIAAAPVVSTLSAVVLTRQLDKVTAENYRPVNAKDFSFPFLLLNFLLVLGFATAVLITILH